MSQTNPQDTFIPESATPPSISVVFAVRRGLTAGAPRVRFARVHFMAANDNAGGQL